ncbi:MAG: serine hydrolase domain-containing protein [Candidatus Nanopelagicales bacterium]
MVSAAALAVGLVTPGPASAAPEFETSAAVSQKSQASHISRIVRRTMKDDHLRAVIVRVTKGDKVIMTKAFGSSLSGVPATPDMRFRNGAVAFAYVATLLMRFVDQGKVRLGDTVDRWMPGLPLSHKVTLKMLGNQTSGYPDYEEDPTFTTDYLRNPFQTFSFKERRKIAFSRPQLFPPGTNWSYSHTNFMVLGKILSKVGGKPLATLLRQQVLRPMGLSSTVSSQTSQIPSPVLHSFSSERRGFFAIPTNQRFYEESTSWNSAWGTPVGATQTTDVYDLTRSADSIGSGSLLSRSSYRKMTGPHLLGFGKPQDNCVPECFRQVRGYNYGIGIVRSGRWLLQNPLLGGYSAAMATLPQRRISIAVVATFREGAFDADGNYPGNPSDAMWRLIGTYLAPNQAPPIKK